MNKNAFYFFFANSWKIENKAIPCTWIFAAFVEKSKIKLRCFLFPLMMFLFDWSPPVINWVDWTWCGKAYTRLSIYSTADSSCQSTNQAMKSQGLCVVSRYLKYSSMYFHYCQAFLVSPYKGIVYCPQWKLHYNAKARVKSRRYPPKSYSVLSVVIMMLYCCSFFLSSVPPPQSNQQHCSSLSPCCLPPVWWTWTSLSERQKVL